MVEIDLSRCRLPPYHHQVEGIEKLVTHPYFFLALDMGCGKTKIVIDAAQLLFEAGVIDRVIIVCPAAVRSVWYGRELGELSKHLWLTTPALITEFHNPIRQWVYGEKVERQLRFIISNFDFLRSTARLTQLLPYCTSKTLLVLDESSAIKSSTAIQTKSCFKLRARCGRVVLLNGTPVSNHPGDMFSQGNILHKSILDCPSITQFRARYAIMVPVLGAGGKPKIDKWGNEIRTESDWCNIDDLQRRFAPYVIRRLKADVLDLPEKLPSVALGPALDPPTWKIYRQMRDDLVAWLTTSTVSQAPQVITKVMRLSQITSGFLGGVEEMVLNDQDAYLPGITHDPDPNWTPADLPVATKSVQEIGREKLDFFLSWLDSRLEEDPNIKVLVWSRFRAEILRLETTIGALPGFSVGTIIGGQKPKDRENATRLLDPRTMPPGPVVVIGNPSAGGMGLNLTGSHTVVYMSNNYNLKDRLQSEDRVHRPGQRNVTSYFDIVATGPKGQRTIDHIILGALLKKDNLAQLTTSAWIKTLSSDEIIA